MSSLRVAPIERRRGDIAAIKQPSVLAGLVTVGALADFGNPIMRKRNPSTGPFAANRLSQSEILFVPCIAISRMLKNSAKVQNAWQSFTECPAIVADLVAVAGLIDLGERLAPASAGRVRHDRVRTFVLAGVSRLVPRVNARKPEVGAGRLDE
jgi:hypothetical protein